MLPLAEEGAREAVARDTWTRGIPMGLPRGAAQSGVEEEAAMPEDMGEGSSCRGASEAEGKAWVGPAGRADAGSTPRIPAGGGNDGRDISLTECAALQPADSL